MSLQYQPARQKCLLSLKHDKFTAPDSLLPDVLLILNVCLEMELNEWIQVNDFFLQQMDISLRKHAYDSMFARPHSYIFWGV